MLLSGLGNHLCNPLPALIWEVACHLPSLSAFPVFLCLFTESLVLKI
jgi:hypothetical protein